MPIDYYPQKSVEELLVILDSLQKRASTGLVYFSTVLGGTQSQKSFQGSSSTAVEIRRVLYSLFKRDPDNYPNPYASRIRKTRPHYMRDPGIQLST